MIGEADAIWEELGKRTPVQVRQATFAEVGTDLTAWVIMGDSRFAATFTGHVPQVGETVNVVSIGEKHLMLPARPLPGTGTVLTVSSGRVTVQTILGPVSMPYVGDAPSSGDLVGISWSGDPYVVGKLSVQPPAPDPIPDPEAGTVRSATFMAIDAGSANAGTTRWWQAQPWASDTTIGAWFYGTQIKDTIPSGATLVGMEFYAAWQQRQGDPPRWGLHGFPFKGGAASVDGNAPWVPVEGWNAIPWAADWFTALKAGGIYYGIGLNHGGWNKFSSLAQNAWSGALRISWRA